MEACKPAVIPEAVRVEFRSEVNQRWYSISLARPLVVLGKRACPVLYVFDGDWYFASAVEVVRSAAPGVAVVGIGYPNDEAYLARVLERYRPLPAWCTGQPTHRVAIGLERTYDLSLPADDKTLCNEFPGALSINSTHVGGLVGFLRVLEMEIRPLVRTMVSVDPSNQAIFGHSLGGLAVVHALFTQPSTFRTFIAASPSIWWSQRAVLAGEARFADAVRAGTVAPRVLVTVGGEEQQADPGMAAKLALDVGEYSTWIRSARMVEDAQELTERLRSLRGTGEFKVAQCAVFRNQHHNTSAWPALGLGVLFAFSP